jgi:hypothetical protein
VTGFFAPPVISALQWLTAAFTPRKFKDNES